MTPNQVQSALREEREQFDETVLLPNTLQRNLVLAGHRAEIARLEKIAAKPATSTQEFGKAKKSTKAAPPNAV